MQNVQWWHQPQLRTKKNACMVKILRTHLVAQPERKIIRKNNLFPCFQFFFIKSYWLSSFITHVHALCQFCSYFCWTTTKSFHQRLFWRIRKNIRNAWRVLLSIAGSQSHINLAHITPGYARNGEEFSCSNNILVVQHLMCTSTRTYKHTSKSSGSSSRMCYRPRKMYFIVQTVNGRVLLAMKRMRLSDRF